MKRIFTSNCKACNTPYKSSDVKRTIPGLSLTPAQIKQMADRGIPISPRGMQEFYNSEKGWYVDPIFRRGADINQLWEMEKNAQARVLSARKRDVLKYGI